MIQPLRQLHGRVSLVLAVALPILFVSGVASRKSLPKTPAARVGTNGLAPVAQQTVQVNGFPVRLSTFRDREGVVLQISSANALIAPDLLVYASTSESKDMVTGEATFLGAYAPEKMYRLPSEGVRFVTLYSLGQQQILASVPLGGAR